MPVSTWKRIQQASGWPLDWPQTALLVALGLTLITKGEALIHAYFWLVRATAAVLIGVTS